MGKQTPPHYYIVHSIFLFAVLGLLFVAGYNYATQLTPASANNATAELQNASLSVIARDTPIYEPPPKPTPEPLTAQATGDQLYVRVTDSCGPYYEGACLRIRSGPGIDHPVVASARVGMVLKVEEKITSSTHVWYKVVFDEWLRYPERVTSDWYIASDFVEEFYDLGTITQWDNPELVAASSSKRLLVDRSDQTLYAYEDEELVMEIDVSTGLEISPTPRGTFTIFKKTPSRYMQGPLPYLENSDYYDLPGVPWNMYFTEQGAVVHGAYWHDNFGSQFSHGCVNISTEIAEQVYRWTDLGTTVTIRD